MKNIFYSIILILGMLIIYSCASKKPYYLNSTDIPTGEYLLSDEVDYELYLVGDVGRKDKQGILSTQIVDLIAKEVSNSSYKHSVVLLGNSMSNHDLTDNQNAKLYDGIKKLIGSTDDVLFIPGDEEWHDGSGYSVSSVQQNEDILQALGGDKNIVKPSNGCGEPEVIQLTDDLILVLVDSQWLLQGDDNSERKRSGCEIDNSIEFITYMEEIVARNKRKNIVIATHHPVMANGKVGGNYSAASHLLPLPIVGTLITGVKQLVGGEQKFGHPIYEEYRAAMFRAIQNCEGCITVAGHENSMQYYQDGTNHHVVAGSSNRVDYARKGDGSTFSYMNKGYAKITHTKNLELWLDFMVPDGSGGSQSVYRKMLHKRVPGDYNQDPHYDGDENHPASVKTIASNIYEGGSFFTGQLYRSAWSQEVEVPVLMLDQAKGGLKPIKQDGGFQTKSLRLKNDKGQQFVLRSINKDVTKVVPPALRNTFAQNLIQDGIGASHPYGAFVIPTMAKAAGIYHANPMAVYLPHQKALGEYDREFAEGLYLFEERPGGELAEFDNFGNTDKAISTPDLLEKMRKNHKHKVDQEFALRSRLFDLFVGDWDRHDDQWRWARFEQENNNFLYRPIPRDRDQVFFKNDGFFHYLANRPYFNPQLRKFDDEIDFLPGVIFNARYFDRSFLNQLTREQFISVANDLQSRLTDEVIDDAFNVWSEDLQKLHAGDIKRKLRKRRADLAKYAGEFYDYISIQVSFASTNDKDLFELTTLANDQLDVKVYRTSKSGVKKHLLFSRVLKGSETKELILYGLQDQDKLTTSGSHKSSIKTRFVGGGGKDQVDNQASHAKLLVYDKPQGITMSGESVTSKVKDVKGVNRYNRADWQQDRFIHFPLITFYTDAGVGLSYNIWWKKFGFRSDPYKSNHTLSVAYFQKNSAILAQYASHYPKALGSWDFGLDATLLGPTFTQFFYGLGNAYESKDESSTFFVVRGNQFNLDPKLIKPLKNGQSITVSPNFEYLNLRDNDLDDNEPRFIYDREASNRTDNDFISKKYLGLSLGYKSSRLDNPAVPSRGFVFDLGADYKFNVDDSDFNPLTLSSNLTTYIPFSQTKNVVLALNLGGAYTFGDYEFFHANYLSSTTRLRGFRQNRFGGDGMAYLASDLRIKIAQGQGSVPIGIGLFGSFDIGRVWLEEDADDLDDWHSSVGGGLYLTPLNLFSFRLGYFVGEDDTQINIGGSLSF